MSIKTPRLIRDRCGVYYFRFVVPAALLQTIGKIELRLTGCRNHDIDLLESGH